MASNSTQAQQHHGSSRPAREDDDNDIVLSSESMLWLPNTVVKRHRTKATIIWVSLLAVFAAYVGVTVWDTFKARRDPPSSFKLKEGFFSFPDVGVCILPNQGCLASAVENCLETASFTMNYQEGFLEDGLEADEASLALEEVRSCKFLPLSQLTVNQTAVENGDIETLGVSLAMFWFDDPNGEYDPTDEDTSPAIYRMVHIVLKDIHGGEEAWDDGISSIELPYDRNLYQNGTTLTLPYSHVVLDLTTFQGISPSTGRKQEVEYTYSKSTTNAELDWYWELQNIEIEMSSLFFDLYIPKFERTVVEEVDPVDAWTIVGAIGGVWQLVIIAFGLFFVFSQKQSPDKKMRNFRKTVAKPVAVVGRRFSSVSNATSSQEIELDATDEDLPPSWVKRQRKSGSIYYFNTITGESRKTTPHERDEVGTGTATAAPPQRRTMNRLFKPAHQPAPDDSNTNTEKLPPGWAARQDEEGKTYYVNSALKKSQWERPTKRDHSSGGSGVIVVDAPMSLTRRGSNSSTISNTSYNGRYSADAADAATSPDTAIKASLGTAPSYRTATSVMAASVPTSNTSAPPPYSQVSTNENGAGDSGESLPPGWQRRSTSGGKTYYSHAVTRRTQWEAPQV